MIEHFTTTWHDVGEAFKAPQGRPKTPPNHHHVDGWLAYDVQIQGPKVVALWRFVFYEDER
jgi:hypothetical protein